MQLTHVSTNLRQGLRRNLSMHAAVVLTLFVSLTLAGLGLLLKFESDRITDQIGSELTLTVYLCTPNDALNPNKCTAEITDADRERVQEVITANPEVDGAPVYVTKQEAYNRAKELLGPAPFEGRHPAVTLADLPSSYVVTLKDPQSSAGVTSAVEGLEGVSTTESSATLVGRIFDILDYLKYGSFGAAGLLLVSAVLLVANTIRLAALARRREIEIMRLVGASRIFIALPFLLEALVNAFIGVVLADGALAALMQFVVRDGLAGDFPAFPVATWSDYVATAVAVAIAGPVLTIVPTLLVTRKYLRV